MATNRGAQIVAIWNVLFGAALLGAAEFEATTLDGRLATGQLVELSAQQVVLETPDGRSIFDLGSLAALARKGADAPAVPKALLWVELVDESGLASLEYTVTDGTAHVTLTGGAKLEIPTRAIRWVRFTAPAAADETLDKQWSAITKTPAGGDLLVVRKSGQLDYLEGVLGNVDAETCRFEIDKEAIPVKRAKVEGIVYFHSAVPELPEAVGRANVGDGSRLTITSATLDNGTIKFATPAGVSLALPVDAVARLDFTAGKITYLSDLEPERATYAAFFGINPDVPALHDFYGYRRDIGFENGPLELDGKTYRKGLSLQSRAALTYRLPGKFRLLKAVVGIDDSVRATGSATLRIKADEKVIWEGDVRGAEGPRELELDIQGARRLEIVADYGEDQDVGDRVDLAEARVTK